MIVNSKSIPLDNEEHAVTTAAPFSLSEQSILLAEIDGTLEDPLPVFGNEFKEEDPPSTCWVLTGPLRALGLELLRAPPPDNSISDRWQRIAANMLRLAQKAADEQKAGVIGPSTPGCWNSAHAALSWELMLARNFSQSDREKLKAAIRTVVE